MTVHFTPLALMAALMATFAFIAATWKLFRFIFKIDRALPTLLNIATQFENNGGSTLKDKIDQLIVQGDEQKVENRVVLKIAEDSRLIAQTNSKIVNELSLAQTEDIKHMREYLHEKMHALSNSIGAASLQANIIEKRNERIEKRLDDIVPYIIRNREDQQ